MFDPNAWFLSMHDAVLRIAQGQPEGALARGPPIADGAATAERKDRDGTATERLPRGESRDWIFVDQARTEPPAHDMAMPATTRADDI